MSQLCYLGPPTLMYSIGEYHIFYVDVKLKIVDFTQALFWKHYFDHVWFWSCLINVPTMAMKPLLSRPEWLGDSSKPSSNGIVAWIWTSSPPLWMPKQWCSLVQDKFKELIPRNPLNGFLADRCFKSMCLCQAVGVRHFRSHSQPK